MYRIKYFGRAIASEQYENGLMELASGICVWSHFLTWPENNTTVHGYIKNTRQRTIGAKEHKGYKCIWLLFKWDACTILKPRYCDNYSFNYALFSNNSTAHLKSADLWLDWSYRWCIHYKCLRGHILMFHWQRSSQVTFTWTSVHLVSLS